MSTYTRVKWCWISTVVISMSSVKCLKKIKNRTKANIWLIEILWNFYSIKRNKSYVVGNMPFVNYSSSPNIYISRTKKCPIYWAAGEGYFPIRIFDSIKWQRNFFFNLNIDFLKVVVNCYCYIYPPQSIVCVCYFILLLINWFDYYHMW